MRIAGEWLKCPEVVTRAVVMTRVPGRPGRVADERFLIDSGADSTVFSATLLAQLPLPTKAPSSGFALSGISGCTGDVIVSTMLQFDRDDGGISTVRGNFAAFLDPLATDRSILGRDVLDLFDVILSRQLNEVHLLAPNHQYHITS